MSRLVRLAMAGAACLALAASPWPAQAQFRWPWESPPPPPPLPAPPVQPPRPRPAAPKPAPKPAEGKAGQQADQPEPPPPPYEPQLMRLSEIMGALAFLRPLCGGKDEEEWRGRMTSLIAAEAATQARRERLAGSYNRGYRNYAQTYRTCTPAAQTIISRYLDEGGRLARELSSRYGG
ncbi:TIGR02301 family protein [Alsobacter sp. SYSU M60028]|uniref:TIGR02301 family protein n=1 Tax=Alsobacter ponti TaxID=2962936 RepID=A0ABT1LC32_9HYPH|nr:TIGR02301 family protein [Alsobacter ponti]MCP8939059.1 TIGR02301 family protein [Alsobacter ponti]